MLPFQKQFLGVPQWLELLLLLVLKELRLRYKRSVLGYLWALANPFAFALVYWVAFKFVMRIQVDNYSIFVLTGMFPWAWLNNSVIQATGSYTNNTSMVKRVRLPKSILPLSHVLQEVVHFMLALPVVFCFVLMSGGNINLSRQWWQIPLLILAQTLFAFPLAMLGAVLNVFVRDVQYVVGILFSLLFFATPMVYPISMVPKEYQLYFRISPICCLIECWRDVFLRGALAVKPLGYLLVWSVIFGTISTVVYRRLSPKIAELV